MLVAFSLFVFPSEKPKIFCWNPDGEGIILTRVGEGRERNTGEREGEGERERERERGWKTREGRKEARERDGGEATNHKLETLFTQIL